MGLVLWRFKIYEVVLSAVKIWKDVGLVLWRFQIYEVVLGAVKISADLGLMLLRFERLGLGLCNLEIIKIGRLFCYHPHVAGSCRD